MDTISAILNIGSTLINKIFPDKTEAAKAQLKLLELQQNGELEELKISLSAILAEAQSTDKWTSRARPSFMYIIYTMIIASIPIGILNAFEPAIVAQIEIGLKGWLGAIPESLWALFGAGYLGYTGARSYDKKQILSIKK